jgi:hypothetical protein
MCDYIAYAVLSKKLFYLLPMLQLQEAWRRNAEEWKKKYPLADAHNHTYVTLSWGIPTDVLFAAMGECLCVKWGKVCEPPRFSPMVNPGKCMGIRGKCLHGHEWNIACATGWTQMPYCEECYKNGKQIEPMISWRGLWECEMGEVR